MCIYNRAGRSVGLTKLNDSWHPGAVLMLALL